MRIEIDKEFLTLFSEIEQLENFLVLINNIPNGT